ncbi:MAG: 16S rRNA (cytosine(1402)-N(4))-methyltransferase RsmH [Candidatus Margulisiibacteriota bacterium]
MSDSSFHHIPVLLKEAIELLNVKDGGTYVDCTLGGGGHTDAIVTPGVRVFAFDQDTDAIAAAKEKLSAFDNITYVHDNFSNLKKHIKTPVDGIFFDLGVSSYQIDAGKRGFSIREDGPLDMRMDQAQELTAEEIINHYPQSELEKIFFEFGEERFSRRIAAVIIKSRPLKTTFALKAVIEKAIPTWKKRESVTRIFQALRIAVNQELENLKLALRDGIDLLSPAGRIVVIAYHSLEDRIVKQTFRDTAGLKVLTKKPLLAGEDEIALNSRAKSAKLRAGEKL